MGGIKKFAKREPVLIAALAAMLVSMAAVPPGSEYLGYIDLRVLCLLFCLMAVIAGLQSCNLFFILAQRLLTGRRRIRTVAALLALLPFFTSMVVTNDVALITFVPFSILVMTTIGRKDLLIWVIVMQTVAANLGSMATPVGNPQNLFLYAHYGLSAGEFFGTALPLTIMSFVLVVLMSLRVPKTGIEVRFLSEYRVESPKRLALYGLLFVLCLLSVFRVLHYGILTAVVLASVFVSDRRLLSKVDYGLLLTFVCFFVFAGNIGVISQVRQLLGGWLKENALLTAVASSQVISNVPASVLLSGFTENWKCLLAGTNLGGLGTLIASLASLISFKFYIRVPGAKPLGYLGVFTLVNILGLLVLVPPAFLIV